MFLPIRVIETLADDHRSGDLAVPAPGSRLKSPYFSSPAQDITQGNGLTPFEREDRLFDLLPAGRQRGFAKMQTF